MKKKKALGLTAVVLLVVVVAGGGFFAFQKRGAGDAMAADSTAAGGDKAEKDKKDGKEEKKPVKVPVELAAAERRDIPAYFQATGSLEAKRSVDLIAKASGQVIRIRAEEGDYVEAGQVLVEIEHREEEIRVEQAGVTLATAEKELNRIQDLLAKGLTADRTYEEALKTRDLATHERNLARVHLDNKIVKAPFKGQIAMRQVELGQTVSIGQPLFRIADVDPLEVRLFLPEAVVKQLKTGQRVEIRPDIAPDRALEGLVHMISPVVDPATSTVKVTIQIFDKLGAARVGSFVRARITTDVRQDVVSVPKRALVPEAGATYVFVAEADSVRKILVGTGYATEEHIEITDGLQPGQQVVSVGQGALRDGSKIRDLAAERENGGSSGDGAAEPDAEIAANDHD